MLTREEIATRNDFKRSPLRPAEEYMLVKEIHQHFKEALTQHECIVFTQRGYTKIILPPETEKRNIFAECLPTIWNEYQLPDGYTFRRMSTDAESIAYCLH